MNNSFAPNVDVHLLSRALHLDELLAEHGECSSRLPDPRSWVGTHCVGSAFVLFGTSPDEDATTAVAGFVARMDAVSVTR